MTTTFNSPGTGSGREAMTLAGADIFRRLERRRRRPLWTVLLPIAVLAAFLVTGVLILDGVISGEAPTRAAPVAPPVVAAPVAPPAAASRQPAARHHHRRALHKRTAPKRAETESVMDAE